MSNVKLKNMTPTEMFKQRVQTSIEGIRLQNAGTGTNFMPLQLGGIFAQREILEGGNVMRIVTLGKK